MEQNSDSFDDDYAVALTLENDVSVQETNVSYELETFRQQWKNEVAAKHQKVSKSVEDFSSTPTVENKIQEARKHFLKGVESERCGEMINAVKSYRVALQLDPEIEQKIDKMQGFDQQGSDDELENESLSDSTSLVEKFSSLNLSPQYSSGVLTLNQSLHILQLPSEVVCHIFRCVASSHLDMKSIESLSETCRLFYVHARDQTLWKAACEKIWGSKINTKTYMDWRKMLIERPHVRMDGAYISKIIYFRQGDPTALSSNYEPFQCVVYYRYLRFFDDNTMLLYTSADEPSVVVPKLHLKNTEQLQFRTGKYRCHSESVKKYPTVTVTGILEDSCDDRYSRKYFRRPTKSERHFILKESQYYIDFELTSSSFKRRFNKMSWLNYSCRYKYSDEHFSPVNEINLTEQYPPFYFSKVKSYIKRSSNPL